MKKLLLTIVWTLSILLPIKSFAQGLVTDEEVEPYAVLSDDNTVLTFYFDEKKTANGGMGVGPFTSNVTSWFDYRPKIKKVVFDASMADCNTITSTAYWFNGCTNLATIENIANLNTDNVLTMREMFNSCSSLESLDLKSFKTGKVTDMQSMFNSCSSLTYLNVQGFETAAVTDMSWMFAGCSKLTTLDVSSFNTRQVKTMHMMFSNCSELENLDLGSFTTDNATMLSYMFRGCSSLTTLDLSTFKTSSVTDMTSMFSGCSNLTTIYASKRWNTDIVTNSSGMFTGCTNLLGGNNTAYDSGHADVEYACIDGENGKPGYLTYKYALVVLDMPTISFANNTVTITSSETGASIYYTLDGSTPTTSSMLYTGPVTLTQNCTVKAIATKDEMENSEEAILEVGGLTMVSAVPMPVISQNVNDVTIIVPGISNNSTDVTSNVAEEPASWGGSAPNADLSGEWTCTVLDNENNPTDTYTVILKSDGKAEFPGQAYVDGGWSYNNGSLSLNHYLLLSGDNYNYQNYSLTTATPNSPMEFAGTKTSTYGNAWTENNSSSNVILTYNGASISVKLVSTSDGRETTVAIFDEGNSENTGTLLQQTVTGLENGYYTVELYAKSTCSSAQSMSTDVTSLFANNVKLFIPLEADKEIREHNVYKIGVEVTDGTLHLGLSKEKNGANWHALQIKSLRWHALSTAQPMPDAKTYYTLDGSNPTISSTLYTYPVSMTQSCIVKAIAVADGYQSSEIASRNIEFTSTEPEPYAVLSEENTVLTFYYDDKKTDNGGMSVGPFSAFSERGWTAYYSKIKKVVFDSSMANCESLTSTAYWFCGCDKLTTIEHIEYLKTQNVTNMSAMFEYCSGLTSLDVSGFDTQNVTDMNFMFYGCSGLTSLDVMGFNTQNVTNMECMFHSCSGLTSLDVAGFNTENVTNMGWMFDGCSGLTNLDVTGINTQNVTEMSSMFYRCSGLKSLDLSSFNTQNVPTMSGMFMDCSSLTTIYVGNEWSTASVTESGNMFFNCTQLIGGAGTKFDANHTDFTYAHIDGGTTNPGYLTDINGPLPYAVLSEENTVLTFYYDENKATTPNAMSVGPFTNENTSWYDYRSEIKKVVFDASMANCNTITSTAFWFFDCRNIKTIEHIEYLKTENVTNMSYMFLNCLDLTNLDVSGFKTENVTTMGYMFGNCSGLTSLDVTGFNTQNVKNIGVMFAGCSGLTSLDVTGFNTENVVDMNRMFDGCSGLTSLDVSGFNTENVDDMRSMFQSCSGLTTLDVSGFKTENVLYMADMFDGCSGLTSIDVKNFKTDKVEWMYHMFSGCSGLTSLDLSSFNTAKVEDMSEMFYSCSNLTTIYASNKWSTASVTEGDNMFLNCTKLKGGAGTEYDANHTDHTYAHIDGGTSNPGYFTDKNAANFIQFEDDAVKALCVANWDKDGDGELSYDEAEAVTSLNKVFSMQKDITRFNELEYFTGLTTIEAQAFAGCIQLASITLPESIRSVGERAFQGCTSFEMVGLPMEVEYIGAYAFEGCTMLREMFTPQRLQQLERGTFANCTGLEYVMMEGPVETIADSVFAGCSRLGWIEIPQTVTSFGKYIFDGCEELHEVMMHQLTITTIPEGMFRNCANLHHAEIPASVTKIESLAFQNCAAMEVINIPSGVTSMGERIFAGCTNLQMVYTDIVNPFVINSNNFDNETYQNATLYIPTGTLQAYSTTESWKRFLHISDGKEAYAVLGEDDNHELALTFYYDANRANYNNTMSIEPFATADERGWAGAASSIKTVKFDESFAYCATVTSTAYWFANCASLTSIEGLGYLNTENVTSMKQMFSGCANLSALEVSGFNTENVEDMSEMFLLCQGLNHLELINFNTSNVKDMTSMFSMCSNLEELDLSSFNTSNVQNMTSMFFACTSLQTIYVGHNWTTSKVTEANQMFYECHSLRGGQGTEYSQQHTGVDYAHIDGGTANPGYLTSADGSDITEFELDGIWYRVRNIDNHTVTVARVMYANHERYVPSEVEYGRNHWRVTALGEMAFADLHEVVVIGVPETIDSISVELFNHCTHLAAIIWETNVPLTLAAMSQFDNPNLLLYMNNPAAAPAGVTNIIDMRTNTAERIVLTDAESGNDFYCPEPFIAKEISYTHSYDQATKIGVCQGWESIVLPFDVQTYTHETKGEIYPIASLLDEQIELDGDKPFWLYEFTQQGEFKEADKIRANVPYILSMPNDPVYWDSFILSGKVTFKATNVEVMHSEHAMYVEGGNRVFVPNYENADYNNPDAYLLNVGDAYEGHLPGSVFSAERSNRKAHPFEAYFLFNGMHPAKHYINIFDKDASAIREIPVNSTTLKGAYDLMGRKVDGESTLPRGVYIIDGKKVMVK